MRFHFCAAILLCSLGLRADQITLKNGDRVTGTVVKKDGKTLTVKTTAFGVITTPWDQVGSVTTDEPVSVELSGGRALNGVIEPGPAATEVITPVGRHPILLEDVTAIRNAEEQDKFQRLLAPPWNGLWSGALTLGIAGTQGNAETLSLNVDLNASRVTRRDKTTLHLHGIKASALIDGTNAVTAKAVRGGWSHDRNFTSRMFVNAFNDYEFDRFQNLDLRFVIGGGAGITVWKEERNRLDFVTGGAYNREDFSQSEAEAGQTRSSAEIYFGDEYSLKLTSVTSLYQNVRFFTNLSKAGEYRVNFDLGANTKLVRWLTWTTTLSNRYLSNPVSGRQNNDFLYSTGIGLTFSN